jgi:hypothetical protein
MHAGWLTCAPGTGVGITRKGHGRDETFDSSRLDVGGPERIRDICTLDVLGAPILDGVMPYR